ncbi:hypothetical protein Cgig2_020364 [Carnegiea gigantea]|uniref:Uncharacterized protein n=1 Tax=Carnegiea gigantea TaxID=171969 RepID=A0A9Q1QG14_9CARY|nr:hypothetical protein Cgig2_020364 [Carnegiea gigantea]
MLREFQGVKGIEHQFEVIDDEEEDDDDSSVGNDISNFEGEEDEDDPSLYDGNNEDNITNDDDLMPRRRKDFTLSLSDSSSSMETDSSSGSSSSQDKVRDRRLHTERELYQRSICGKFVLVIKHDRFDGEFSQAICNSTKCFDNGQCTCLSNLPPEKLQLWRSTFEGQYTWAAEVIEEVKEGKNMRQSELSAVLNREPKSQRCYTVRF